MPLNQKTFSFGTFPNFPFNSMECQCQPSNQVKDLKIERESRSANQRPISHFFNLKKNSEIFKKIKEKIREGSEYANNSQMKIVGL